MGRKSFNLKPFWDALYEKHATSDFISADPICLPYRFTHLDDKRNVEFVSFLVTLFAYGQRQKIIGTMGNIIDYFGPHPIEILSTTEKEWKKAFKNYYYRFNTLPDLLFILSALQGSYKTHPSLQALWNSTYNNKIYAERIQTFQDNIMDHATIVYPNTYGMRFLLAQPAKGSAAKRLNMFLRWVIRKDAVDLGLWENEEDLASLKSPLDTHVGRQARCHKITNRLSDDWKTVEEITQYFQKLHPTDPARYDIAMMGLGTTTK